jgi:hypothetical protein
VIAFAGNRRAAACRLLTIFCESPLFFCPADFCPISVLFPNFDTSFAANRIKNQLWVSRICSLKIASRRGLSGDLHAGKHLKPVDNFRAAFWGGVVISVVSLLLNTVTGSGDTRIEVRRGKRPPPKKPGDGNGPIIDV